MESIDLGCISKSRLWSKALMAQGQSSALSFCPFAFRAGEKKNPEDSLPFCLRYTIFFFIQALTEPPKYLPDLCDEVFFSSLNFVFCKIKTAFKHFFLQLSADDPSGNQVLAKCHHH